MKWWGWLAIAIGGSIMWAGLVAILTALEWVPGGRRTDEVLLGGAVLIWGFCGVIPVVQKAIKAAKSDE